MIEQGGHYLLIDMGTNDDNDIFNAIVYVYKKDNKYYVEEIRNGVYEIPEDTFDIIKDYAK